MHRLFWSMSTPTTSNNRPHYIDVAQLPMVQVGIDLGLFKTLAEKPEQHFDVDGLAKCLKCDRTLLYRVLRYFFSYGLLQENSNFTYSANITSQWLATPGAEGGVKHYMNNIAPTIQALPEVLRQQGYHGQTNRANDGARRTDESTISNSTSSWTPSDPSAIAAFLEFMKAQRANRVPWTQAFPLQVLKLPYNDIERGRALFVDVGGAFGHQCLALRQQHPTLLGRIILQDKELVIAKADKISLDRHGVEAMAYDFFQEQPIKGARAYYLRNIMHDWPDEKCVEILALLRAALAQDSMILLDDMVVPDKGANWQQAQKSIQMMSCVASMERNETQWKTLVEHAGLRIRKTCTYDKDLGDSVLIVVAA